MEINIPDPNCLNHSSFEKTCYTEYLFPDEQAKLAQLVARWFVGPGIRILAPAWANQYEQIFVN